MVSRFQKKTVYKKELTGQINCVDISVKDKKYDFALFCGTEESGIYNLDKSLKIKTIGTTSVASTAISVSPDSEYYAYAIGSDWCQGMNEMGLTLNLKIFVAKLSLADITSSPMGQGYIR